MYIKADIERNWHINIMVITQEKRFLITEVNK